MIILGVDPGAGVRSATGYAIINFNNKELLDYGHHKVSNSYDIGMKCFEIAAMVYDFQDGPYEPEAIAIEQFVMRGKGGMTLQRIIGAVLGAHPHLEPLFPGNTELKRLISGSGAADKKDVAIGVIKWLGDANSMYHVDKLMQNEMWDTIDAIAIAIAGGMKECSK